MQICTDNKTAVFLLIGQKEQFYKTGKPGFVSPVFFFVICRSVFHPRNMHGSLLSGLSDIVQVCTIADSELRTDEFPPYRFVAFCDILGFVVLHRNLPHGVYPCRRAVVFHRVHGKNFNPLNLLSPRFLCPGWEVPRIVCRNLRSCRAPWGRPRWNTCISPRLPA